MKRKLMFFMTFLFIGIGLATAQTSKVTGLVTSEEDGRRCFSISQWHHSWYNHRY